MNSKKGAKSKRRLVKSNSRVDKMGQHNRTMERKPNLGSKRVTLLPGFLINGFTSDTARKGGGRRYQKSKEQVLPENLQAIFDQKSNLRRSQRLSKRCNSDSSRLPYEHTDVEASRSHSPPIVHSDTFSYKSILKKNPKSIFKEISDKISKVESLQAEEAHKPREVYRITRTLNSKNGFIVNQNVEPRHYHSSQHSHLTLNCNTNFCTSFSNKIRVTFKKDVVKECKEFIKKEIKNVNLILSGKAKIDEKTPSESDDNDLEDRYIQNTVPIPPGNWVYYTPNNQSITAVRPLECQLKPGVILPNNNRFDLYDIKPQYKMVNSYHLDRQVEKSPTGAALFRNEVAFDQMPPNFGLKRNQLQEVGIENAQQNHSLGMEAYKPQCNCIRSSCHPYNSQMETHYSDNYIPFGSTSNTPMVPDDFETGNYFKIQKSQAKQLNKKDMYDEDHFMGTPSSAVNSNESSKNMFNFNNARGNMFDFG